MTSCPDKEKSEKVQRALQTLRSELEPEIFAEVSGAVGSIPGLGSLASNQNQNQNGAEELVQLKPEVISSVISFRIPGEGDAESNQNQNQNGGIARLALEKPELIQQLAGRG